MRRSVLIATFVMALPMAAQTRPVIGVGVSAGTMGIGVDGALQLTQRIGVRARIAFMPYEPKFTIDDIEFDFTLPTPQMGLFADLTLIGPLRVTGGLRYSTEDISATAVPTASLTIGDSTYTGAQIVTFAGVLTSAKLAPYLGIGLGKVAGRGIGFFMDAGVAFVGTPELTFSATGPFASQPIFRTELAREQASANDTIADYGFYPVIALGLRFGF